jgi:hypothetical protein
MFMVPAYLAVYRVSADALHYTNRFQVGVQIVFHNVI